MVPKSMSPVLNLHPGGAVQVQVLLHLLMGSFSVESDPPHGVDSPQDRDPTGIHPDGIGENKKNEMNGRDKKNGKLIT